MCKSIKSIVELQNYSGLQKIFLRLNKTYCLVQILLKTPEKWDSKMINPPKIVNYIVMCFFLNHAALVK